MTLDLTYRDTATFVKVSSGRYANSKVVESRDDVPVIFVQNTQFNHTRFQDGIDSDAVCWPDPCNDFITDNYNRLEGMYILMNLYGSPDAVSWYKVINVTVNRDHLLGTDIDNVELRLKKTEPIPGVS